jgi:hypothetical protein
MPKAVSDLTDVELQNVIENYRRKELTSEPYFLSALEEMGRRKGAGLDFDKTLRAVLKAAREGRFLSYGQLAEESGLDWSKARYAMNGHLGDLIEYSYRMGWPLLSAIVVNKENLASGAMEPSTLKGFVTAAAELGCSILPNGEEFMRRQQRAVFDWAKSFRED